MKSITAAASLSVKRTKEEKEEGKGRKIGTNDRKENKRINRQKKKGKAIPVTDREGPYRCETSKLQHFLDNQLTDGGEVVSLTRRPAALYPFQEDSWYSFLLEAESTPGA
jgi:hypothetical protein